MKKYSQTTMEEARRRWNPFPWTTIKKSEKTEPEKPAETEKQKPAFDYETLRRFYLDGLSDEQIAVKANCNVKTVRKWRKRNGLESNYIIEQKRRMSFEES